MGDIVDELVGGEPRHKLEEWLPEARRTPLFEYLEVTETPHAQELTPDGVIDRLRSISVVAAAPPDRRADVEARVAELLRTDPVTAGLDVIRLPYATRIHWLRRVPIPRGRTAAERVRSPQIDTEEPWSRPRAAPRASPPPAKSSSSSTRRHAPGGMPPWRQPRLGDRAGRGRSDRGRDRPHRAGHGPAAGLAARGAFDRHRVRPHALQATPGHDVPHEAGRADGRGSVRPMDGVVLVLNQNYEPLNVCNIPRAFRLLFGSKAEVIEYNHADIHTVRAVYRAPSVIRLQHHIRRPRPRVKLTRREIFSRDRHTCQYCGRVANDLTLDHVMPRHRGGGHTWENLVAACKPCNHRKGGRTPEEARFRLLRQPFEPRSDVYILFTPYLEDDRNEAWRNYLFLGRNCTVGSPSRPVADARLAVAAPASVPSCRPASPPSSTSSTRRATTRSSSAARRATCSSAAIPTTGTSRRTPDPSGCSRCSPAPCTRTRSGRSPSVATATCSR